MYDQTNPVVHNPDQYMIDLRRILSQGRKQIGLLIGAGAATSQTVSNDSNPVPEASNGKPLIPDVKGLTNEVLTKISKSKEFPLEEILTDLGEDSNIEEILTRARQLAATIGNAEVHGCNGEAYQRLAKAICREIGKLVSVSLPEEENAYTELISWIGGTARRHAIEIFTPNYDLLLEEAFERQRLPYFDGFPGSFRPFFDPVSVSEDQLPPRWTRLWKIHGSLGWESEDDSVIRTGNRNANALIYPDHLKYDQITRQPFSALYERLRTFLKTPDSLLFCTGFSFSDAQITAVIDEALTSNSHTAVIAFQYLALDEETHAVELARRRHNFSVYARDGAMISCLEGKWKPGEPPAKNWEAIQSTYWKSNGEENDSEFLLGDFNKLTRFLMQSQANSLDLALQEVKLTDPSTEFTSNSGENSNSTASVNDA